MRSKSPFCGTAIPPLRFFSPDNLKITGHFGRLEVTIPGYRLVYTADQLHFHRPTEHTFGGKSYDVEMHIVHSLESGAPKDYVYNKAVIGVVFDATPDKHNNFFDEMQLDKECELDLEELIDRLPKKLYHYQGSLTTPPCTEIVNWFVFKTPLPMSQKQVVDLAHIWEDEMPGCHDNREVQPLNGRKIYKN
eukprot:TRINITY_DN7609_c0_g1_i4.p2 TRINITY_DN7609_c0_g1~~TRINITY_DN7609_c0_g1_i4.p2  ORF type:complete len:191 (-),score=33.43 TRINITY_DN7609_c0_g1_i4:133-705(-)